MGVDDGFGSHPFRHDQGVGVDVDGDDAGFQGGGDHDRGQAHSSATVHGDPFAGSHPTLSDHGVGYRSGRKSKVVAIPAVIVNLEVNSVVAGHDRALSEP